LDVLKAFGNFVHNDVTSTGYCASVISYLEKIHILLNDDAAHLGPNPEQKNILWSLIGISSHTR